MLYGNLNILYTVGDINNVWHPIANIKQLLRKLFLVVSVKITYIIEIIVEDILKNNLLLGLTIGLLCVSAGAFLNVKRIPIKQKIAFKYILIFKWMLIIGNPINAKIELIKQIQLFVACKPNPVDRKTLKSKLNINTSFNIPRNKDISMIIIILEIVKYILTNPYSISFNLILLHLW